MFGPAISPAARPAISPSTRPTTPRRPRCDYICAMHPRSPISELFVSVARANRWATRMTRFSLPPAQARLMAVVEDLGPSRIGDLARADHCSQPTMTTQVQRLEEAGYLAREVDPDDARAVLVDLTTDGHRLLAQIRDDRAEAMQAVYASLSPDEQRDVERATRTLDRLLEAAGSSD